jgi:hypothetical protein
MRECWHWDPRRRPTFLELERRMAHFDSLHVAERNMKRNRGNNVVLDQVFPAHVAKALANGQKLQPEHYDKVTIFFSDIVGFTDISKTVASAKVCDMLDRLYTRFDILTEKYDIFKVETIGELSGGVGRHVCDHKSKSKVILIQDTHANPHPSPPLCTKATLTWPRPTCTGRRRTTPTASPDSRSTLSRRHRQR